MEAMQIAVEAAVNLCNALSAGAEHGCASTGSLDHALSALACQPRTRTAVRDLRESTIYHPLTAPRPLADNRTRAAAPPAARTAPSPTPARPETVATPPRSTSGRRDLVKAPRSSAAARRRIDGAWDGADTGRLYIQNLVPAGLEHRCPTLIIDSTGHCKEIQ